MVTTIKKTLVGRIVSAEGFKWLCVYWIVALSIRLTVLLYTGR